MGWLFFYRFMLVDQNFKSPFIFIEILTKSVTTLDLMIPLDPSMRKRALV